MDYLKALWRVIDFWVFFALIEGTLGRVTIVQNHLPLYVKSGSALRLVCNSNQRVELEWVMQTPHTSWTETVIVPTVGSDYVIRNLVEEPSGYVESTLVKQNMTLQDRGNYICRDKDRSNSFQLWATVLQIIYQNVTASPDLNSVVLHCYISGFDTNIPAMEYTWTKDNLTIPYLNERYEAIVAPDSPGWYKLRIKNPRRSDEGSYQCSFILGTNRGPMTFQETVHLDGSALEKQTDQGTSVHSGLGVVSTLIALILMSLLATSLPS